MTVKEAILEAEKFNKNGLYSKDWFYYPAYIDKGPNKGGWYIPRQLKSADVKIAMFVDKSNVDDKSNITHYHADPDSLFHG